MDDNRSPLLLSSISHDPLLERKPLIESSQKPSKSGVNMILDSIEDDRNTADGQRHLILFAFSLLTFVNSWMWITWSPLTPDPLCDLWDVPSSSVDNLSSLYMYIYLIFSPFALYMLHRYGLRFGLIVGAMLNFIGSLIRVSNVTDYKVVFMGTTFTSLAQGFTLSIPPLIASNWYGESERAKATSIGVLANQMGTATGLGATIFIDFKVSDIEQKLRYYVGVQMIISLLALFFIVIWVTRDKPLNPTNAVALHQDMPPVERQGSLELVHSDANENSETREIKHFSNTPLSSSSHPNSGFLFDFLAVFFSPSRTIFTFIYGICVGVFYCMSTFMNQLFAPLYSPSITGCLGLTLVLSGILGSLWSASIIDRVLSMDNSSNSDDNNENIEQGHKNVLLRFFSDRNGPNVYWKMLMVLLLCACASCAILFILLSYISDATAHRAFVVTLFFLFVSGIGFSLTGIISVGFEFGSALCHPANEAAVGGALNCAAQVGGWILNIIGGAFMDSYEDNNGVWSVPMKLGCVIVSALLCSSLLMWKGVTEKPVRLLGVDVNDESMALSDEVQKNGTVC